MVSQSANEELVVIPAGVRSAVVQAVAEGASGRLSVRLLGEAGTRLEVRPALAMPYRASVGDRVLVASDGTDGYVVGVLHAAAPPRLMLPDGSRAEMVDGGLELRDAEDRLLVRYAGGSAEVSAPHGDLLLRSLEGRVVLQSGLDVCIEARRDVTHTAGRKIDLNVGGADEPQLGVDGKAVRVQADRVDLTAKQSQVALGKATVVARSLATTAESVAYNVERFELTADRLVEKTRDTFRDVSDLLQTRAGRVRTLVEDVYAMYSRRTVMVSKQDTSIDGKRILLG